MLPSGIRLGCFLFKMPEDLLNHFGVFNAGNNLDLTTTVFAHFDIDIEYSLEALHPGHPVMALCGIFVTPVSIEIFQFVGPLAPLSRCHLNTVFTIPELLQNTAFRMTESLLFKAYYLINGKPFVNNTTKKMIDSVIPKGRVLNVYILRY